MGFYVHCKIVKNTVLVGHYQKYIYNKWKTKTAVICSVPD